MPDAANILEKNLSQLRRVEPELAARLREATPAALTWAESKTGLLTATIDHAGKPLTLASRFDPLAEADKLLSAVDYEKHAGIFLLGMGLGHQVTKVAKHMGRDCLVVVYEPNLELLRAVLERVDHSAWLGRSNVILVDSTIDRAGLVRRIEKWAGIITQGTVLVTNPISRALSPDALNNFSQVIAESLAYCRTNVATSLVNASRTIGNLTLNLAYYAGGANTNELFNIARNIPAVCVGAGPSLAKNVKLLADPEIRKNVIVVTAQTTLKPLLDRGIQPDFVTALDYHEISKRFYEGLPELPNVTLVAEAKAHPSIVDSFPGPIRVVQNPFLDRLLGDLTRPMVPIRGGATVAHLSFYLAQHLGCNPIIMIGQDLGFSDGLYYCPGTAIHDVWAPELGQFNTVEMMEWQRIVRHRSHLQKVPDINGHEIYSDEQMLTYLKQFERDFAVATQTVIDATEGGLPKEHTTRMTLAEALAKHATKPAPKVPLPGRGFEESRLEEVGDLLRARMEEVQEVRRITKKTVPILQQMIEHQRDMVRMNKLFFDLERNKEKVNKLDKAFGLVNDLNAIGAFRRARADRALEQMGEENFESQQRRIQRDLDNLDWLMQSCDEATQILRAALARLMEKSKSTRRSGSKEKVNA